MEQGFWSRLTDFRDRVFLGLDFAIAVVTVLILFGIVGSDIQTYNIPAFISGSQNLSTASLSVILTGIAIIVSLSNTKALVVLRKNQKYESFLFTFEFTAGIALLTATLSVVVDVLGSPTVGIYLLLFFTLFLVLAVGTVISKLVTYGKKLATIEALNQVPDDLDVVFNDPKESEESQDNPESNKEKNQE